MKIITTMTSTKKTACALSLLVLAAACSSSNNDNGGNETISIEGDHTIEAVAETEFDSSGGTCGDASGTVTVAGDALTGSVLSTNGFSLDVVGTVTAAGDVTGGFAQGSNTVANFEGSFSGATGTGTWSDNFDCTGTWTSMKVE